MQQRFDEPLFRPADRTAEQQQQVDVRVKTQRTAAISAQRTHRNWRARLSPCGIDELPNDLIDAVRVASQCLAPALAALGRRNQFLARRIERRFETSSKRRRVDVPHLDTLRTSSASRRAAFERPHNRHSLQPAGADTFST